MLSDSHEDSSTSGEKGMGSNKTLTLTDMSSIETNEVAHPVPLNAAQQLEKQARRQARMKKRLEKKRRKKEMLALALATEAEKGAGLKNFVETNKPTASSKDTSLTKEDERKIERKKLKNMSEIRPIKSEYAKVKGDMQGKPRSQVKSKITKPSRISFPVNEECTSLKLSPSGRHIIAGFTDGTLRLFDTTGRLWKPSSTKSCADDPVKSEMNCLFDSDSDDEASTPLNHGRHLTKQRMVASKSFQNFGAVACQIHAKGVITSLLMDVDCSEDGRFAFGGVLRGSTELVALDLSLIEKYHNDVNKGNGTFLQDSNRDILDLIKVHRHSDAKLKGFGACVRVNCSEKPEYRLFTGKGIKNMHIWSFIPPHGNKNEPSWQCLYDTPTNGNTITYLKFRRDAKGLLQGISKSDDQKLRIWDLSYEDLKQGSQMNKTNVRSIIKQLAVKAEKEACENRPKRPPYVDVRSTENALGVCGSYVFSGGDSMYNKMGVMFLDVPDIQSQFNHTELALPNSNGTDSTMSSTTTNRRSARSGRQQRGDLKSVVRVAGLDRDAHHVLLELSDQTLVHYCQEGNQSSLAPLTTKATEQADRKMCVTFVKPTGSTIFSTASYDSNKNRGVITMRILSENLESGSLGSSVRIGFTEPSTKRKKSRPSAKTPIPALPSEPTKKGIAKAEPKLFSNKPPGLHPLTKASSPNLPSEPTNKGMSNEGPKLPSKRPPLLRPSTKTSSPALSLGSTKKGSAMAGSKLLSNKSSILETKLSSPPAKTEQQSRAPPVKSKREYRDQRRNGKEKRSKRDVVKVNSTNLLVTPDPKNRKITRQICAPVKLNVRDVPDSTAERSPEPTKKSNITTMQEQITNTNLVAVSPEQQKTSVAAPAYNPEIDTAKSISKFFKKTKSRTQTKTKKVQFKECKDIPNDKGHFIHNRSEVGISGDPQLVKRTLLEADIVSALGELRNKASHADSENQQSSESEDSAAIQKTRKELDEFLLHCQKRKRPKPMHETNQQSVASRVGFSAPFFKNTKTIFSTGQLMSSDTQTDLDQRHCTERRQLAMHHRASHERLRNDVVSSIERIMNISTSRNESMSFTKAQLIDYARKTVGESLEHHQEVLSDLINRQKLESESLMRIQALEKGGATSLLAVSFPFPEVFDQLRSTITFFSD